MKKTVLCLILLLILFGISACTTTTEVTTADMSAYPNLVSDVENMTYRFSDTDRSDPFWKGNVVYNETVLLLDDGTLISGKLLFAPIRVISVRDYSLKTTYSEGTDYVIDGNVIRRTEGSSIPYLKAENLTGQNIPSPYRQVSSISNVLTDYVLMGPNAVYTESPFWYGSQISVSYVYDVTDLRSSVFPDYDGSTLANTMSLLNQHETLRITAIGDSVLEGCSSSAKFSHEPFMPNFMELSRQALADYYQTEVVLNNLSVGGKTSLWGSGSTVINDIVATNPDVVFIHFGINDNGNGASPNSFRDNIELLILSIREDLPGCEFVILNALAPNPTVYDGDRFVDYWEKMYALQNNHPGVKVIDVWGLSQQLLKVKKYEDLTGNGINHVNDYSARLYLMSIVSTFVTNQMLLDKEE